MLWMKWMTLGRELKVLDVMNSFKAMVNMNDYGL